MSRTVGTFCDLADGRAVPVGTVSFNCNDGGVLVSTTFRYADSWLSAPAAYDLSPELPRGLGVRIASGRRVIPGAIAVSFVDSSRASDQPNPVVHRCDALGEREGHATVSSSGGVVSQPVRVSHDHAGPQPR